MLMCILVQLTAMTMLRILAETNIPDDDERRSSLLYSCDGTLNRALHIPCRRTYSILILRQSEYFHSWYTQSRYFLRQLYCIVYGQVIASRHTRDLFLHVLTRNDKDRIYEILHGEVILSHHCAHIFGNPHPAWTKCLTEHIKASLSETIKIYTMWLSSL